MGDKKKIKEFKMEVLNKKMVSLGPEKTSERTRCVQSMARSKLRRRLNGFVMEDHSSSSPSFNGLVPSLLSLMKRAWENVAHSERRRGEPLRNELYSRQKGRSWTPESFQNQNSSNIAIQTDKRRWSLLFTTTPCDHASR
jgi:hypothetical protein